MKATIDKINELTRERARLFREASNGHRGDPETIARIQILGGELQRLWDLRRKELAGRRQGGVDGLIDREYEQLYGRDDDTRRMSWRELAEAAA